MGVSPPPLKPFSVCDTIQACQGTRGHNDIDEQGALRVLAPCDDGSSFTLVPYSGQPYVAISYCWASGDFRRLGTSNTSTLIQTPNGPILSDHFSQFIARAASISNAGSPERTIWIDYHCINQADQDEKTAQVSIMQRIYTRAEFTLVMLEDTELSSDDRAALGLHFKPNDETIRIIHRLISARWFTRAWCSQELVLSRRAIFFLHNPSSPDNPIQIDADRLWHSIDLARNYDSSIPLFNIPRGLVPDRVLSRTMAYAMSIVRHLGCSDEYDKISLVCNLLRYIYRFTSRPTAFRADPSAASTIRLNVLKMANVMAIGRRDFSLLIANHGTNNPLCGHLGFGWAGFPVHGDRISEMWAPKDYEVHRDPSTTIDNNALVLRGITAEIVGEHVWELHRDHAGLHVAVDGTAHDISLEMQVHEGWTWTRDWQLLRDLMLALTNVASDRHQQYSSDSDIALHARIVLAYLLADPDYQLQPDPIPSDEVLTLTRNVLGGSVRELKHIAAALAFVRTRPDDHDRDRSRGEQMRFSTVLLSEGSVLLVSGNTRASALHGRHLFQPFVARPKMFSPPMVMTANSMVLESEPRADGTYQCVGCVRGLGMISEVGSEAERQLRVV